MANYAILCQVILILYLFFSTEINLHQNKEECIADGRSNLLHPICDGTCKFAMCQLIMADIFKAV